MAASLIYTVPEYDKKAERDVLFLLSEEGLLREKNPTCTVIAYDEGQNPIATGSLYGNTLRALAVKEEKRGEGLLNEVVTLLIEEAAKRGVTKLFVYTKEKTASFISSLGFYEVATARGVCFMENRRDGFSSYLEKLSENKTPGPSSSVVMNANPFTNGHLYLCQTAREDFRDLHVFVLSEENGAISAAVRRRLVEEGVKGIGNVKVHDSGPYIISNATFPSYFLKDSEEVVKAHAELDIEIFKKIAPALNIKARFVGDEPYSRITEIYNNTMLSLLSKAGIECRVIERKKEKGMAISASEVRRRLRNDDIEGIRDMVPTSTYDFFSSFEAKPIIEALKNEQNEC